MNKVSYSQNKEEEVILNYFNGHVGTFVDLGANDGITFSNTRALAERGWKGVLIEPDPVAFSKLKELYKGHKGIYCYDYAISGHNGKAMLQTSSSLLKKGDMGLVSTFHGSEMDRFKSVVTYEPVEVKTFKWKTAINRWQIKKFDFISMDIEGDELSVLPDIDLSETKLVCIEFNGKQDLKTEYEKYLNGFKLLYTSGENLIYGR
jgi:FkbM family methyltransferase